MNTRDIIVWDAETTGKNPNTCELTQIAAVHIHPRRLTLGATFNSEVRPLRPDDIEDEALKVTRKTKEGLAQAPHPKQVWGDFAAFCNRFNPKGSPFFAPIAAGYNIKGYDMVIAQRYAEEYGTLDAKSGKQNLFSNFFCYDMMDDVWRFNENSTEMTDIKLTTVCEYMGLSTADAHDALTDVMNTAKIITKYLKLYRNLRNKISFKGAFA